VEEHFVKQLNAAYSDLQVDRRKILSLRDFTEFIERGPWDNKMRGIVHFAQYRMWDHKQWSLDMEEQFTQMLGIRFIGVRSDGSRQVRLKKGKCAHHLFVRCKNKMLLAVRNTTRRCWLEAILVARKNNKDSVGGDKENTKNIPRIVKYRIASVSGDGFNGTIGLCEGHPSLRTTGKENDCE
jgi:hypothetical protein